MKKVKKIKRNPLPFVHLHSHEEYSLKDGTGKVEQYINRASELDMPGFTITNHGTNGQWIRQHFHIKEVNEARIKEGKDPIKNIFGEELYLMFDRDKNLSRINEINSILESSKGKKKLDTKEIQKLSEERKELSNSYHVVVLAKNQKGFENLLFLHNDAVVNGYYYRPNASFELLKEHSEGLIIMSACLGGIVGKEIMSKDLKEAERQAKMFKKIWGEDFYLEMQLHDFKGQREVNQEIIRISKKLDIKTVITNDSHYLNEEDWEAQGTLTLINSNGTWKGVKEGKGWVFDSKQLWYKTESEIYQEYRDNHSDYLDYVDYKNSILETVKITEKIDSDINFKEKENHIPNFCNPPEDGWNILRKMINKGFRKRKLMGDKKYIERIKYESDIIDYKGCEHYFLIVADLIQWVKKKYGKEAVGKGRGSGASSLINFCLEITDIDPLFWELPFERFLSKGRKDMPDIDTDFLPSIREAIKQYLIDKYGQEYTASISTYGTYQTKACVDDVCRVYDIPLSDVKKLKKSFSEDIDDLEDWDKILEYNPKLLEFAEEYPNAFRVIKTLRGQIRHMSKHAGGMLITKNPIMRDISLYRVGDTIVSSWVEGQTRSELGRIGRVKLDLLGLETLEELRFANNLVEERTGKRIDWDKTNLYNDKLSVKCANKGDTKWIFQFQNQGMSNLLKNAKITSLRDWSAISALGRPGAKRSGMADIFCLRSKGKEEYELHPLIEKVIGETYGVITYQEHVMFLGVILADFTMDEADELRKILTKIKKETEHIYGARRDQLRKMFIERASMKLNNKKEAEKIWDLMALFAVYGFNKAHATSYGVTSSQCLYMFTHHQIEWITAVLNSQSTKFKDDEESKMVYYMKEAKMLGYEFIFPTINISKPEMSIYDEKICYGLSFVKGVGIKASEAICEREYSRIDQFFDDKPKGVNKKVVEALSKIGFFDPVFENRKVIWEAFQEFNDKKKGKFKDYLAKYQHLEDYTSEEVSKFEKEFLGMFINNHPILKYEEVKEEYDLCNIEEALECKKCSVMGMLVNIKPYTCKNGSVMAFSEIEDENNKLSVSIFPKEYTKFKDILKPGSCIAMKVSINNKGVSVDGYADGAKIMNLDDLLPNTHKVKKVKKKKKKAS